MNQQKILNQLQNNDIKKIALVISTDDGDAEIVLDHSELEFGMLGRLDGDGDPKLMIASYVVEARDGADCLPKNNNAVEDTKNPGLHTLTLLVNGCWSSCSGYFDLFDHSKIQRPDFAGVGEGGSNGLYLKYMTWYGDYSTLCALREKLTRLFVVERDYKHLDSLDIRKLTGIHISIEPK